MESSMMNFDNSIQSLNFEMTGQLGGTSKMISGKGNALVNSGRNQMNNEYKSYLQGSTNNQTPAPGGMSLGAKHARGASMGPAFSTNGTNNKLGEIKEIEVSKPDIRLSKELKQKLQDLNQLSPNNRSPNEYGDLDAASKLLKMNRQGPSSDYTMTQTNLNAALGGKGSPENAFNFSKGENSYLVKAG